jgi:putative intracellular protease/amidase
LTQQLRVTGPLGGQPRGQRIAPAGSRGPPGDVGVLGSVRPRRGRPARRTAGCDPRAECDLLRQAYPAVTVDTDAIYVRDGNVWTSAGVTAGIDLALAVVADGPQSDARKKGPRTRPAQPPTE